MLESHLRDTDSPIAATKLSSEIRANSGFLMEVMGVGGEQMKQINQNATPVIPNQQSAVQIGVIEGISFDEEWWDHYKDCYEESEYEVPVWQGDWEEDGASYKGEEE